MVKSSGQRYEWTWRTPCLLARVISPSLVFGEAVGGDLKVAWRGRGLKTRADHSAVLVPNIVIICQPDS